MVTSLLFNTLKKQAKKHRFNFYKELLEQLGICQLEHVNFEIALGKGGCKVGQGYICTGIVQTWKEGGGVRKYPTHQRKFVLPGNLPFSIQIIFN